MRGSLLCVALLLAVLSTSGPAGCVNVRGGTDGRQEAGGLNAERRGKFFSIFNIISFPNNVCNSTTDKTGIFLFLNSKMLFCFLSRKPTEGES